MAAYGRVGIHKSSDAITTKRKDQAMLSQNTFIYILSHENREAAKKSWDGLHNDPQFKTLIEKSGRTTTKADAVFVTPTDYSPLK
jgi:hypothetical protein